MYLYQQSNVSAFCTVYISIIFHFQKLDFFYSSCYFSLTICLLLGSTCKITISSRHSSSHPYDYSYIRPHTWVFSYRMWERVTYDRPRPGPEDQGIFHLLISSHVAMVMTQLQLYRWDTCLKEQSVIEEMWVCHWQHETALPTKLAYSPWNVTSK